MPDEPSNLEARVAELETQIQLLSATVAELQKDRSSSEAKKKVRALKPVPSSGPATSDEILSWVDRSAILPRIATTSFILVLALALRTATDSGALDQQVGSLLGMTYAFALIAFGWFSYSRKSQHAPVFTLWGTIIMYSVVVETHRAFEALPSEPSYMILGLTGLATALMSRFCGVALPVFIGSLGMPVAGFAIDYPNPVFPFLTVLIIAANLFATYATRLLRATWLRWLLLFMSLLMVQIWAMKLNIYLSKMSIDEIHFSIKGFFPAIAGLALTYLGISLLGVLGKIQERISRFDMALPVINVLWVFVVTRYVIHHGLGEEAVFSWFCVVAGVFHFGVGVWLGRRQEGGAKGTSAFILAGGILLAFSLPAATGVPLISLTLISAFAYGVFVLGQQWKSSRVRLTSYLLQIYASVTLATILGTQETAKPSLLGAAASTLVAAVGFWHYQRSRVKPSPEMTGWVADINRGDRFSAVLLLAALVSGFFTLRVGLFQGLTLFGIASEQAFSGGQSALINLAAIVLLILSLVRKNKILRNVGLWIAVVGAAKVFLVDMINLKGIPLMVGVFSFGIAAALASLVLSNWPKAEKGEGSEPESGVPEPGEEVDVEVEKEIGAGPDDS